MQTIQKRVNCGYEIIDTVRVSNNLEFVTAASMCNPNSFVTWGCTNGDNYFWGRYFINRERALADMHTRAADEFENMNTKRETDIEPKYN